MIRFNKPSAAGNEAQYISQAIAQGHLSGDGAFTKRSQTLLEALIPGSRILLTTSCTHALELAGLLLDAAPGDEIIMPSFTFVSTANAFVLRGLRPVFVDIRPDTLNIDEQLIERAITPRTRAIVVVHYAGVACELEPILRIAQQHGLTVIEDNAHGLFGAYRGRALGTFGRMAALSFHETKNVTCGEGGAIVLNDERLVERAEILREKGTDRSRFFRGQVDKYGWVDVGSSYLPSELLAAFLCGQLEQAASVQAMRRNVWERYSRELPAWAEANAIRLPFVPEHCEQAYHMFYLLMPSLEHRQAFIAHMRAHEISAVFHYVPLHTSKMAQDADIARSDCPVTESTSDRLVRLPFYTALSADDQARVIETALQFP
jgi:dTDP-4-amino-4,6-dideoxygalactose transaminase